MDYISRYSKILVAFVLAIVASELLVKEVFLGYSPQVRPDLADHVVERSMALINTDNYIAFFSGENRPPSKREQKENIAQYKEVTEQTPAVQIVPGVYAKETAEGQYTDVNYHEIQWVEVEYARANGQVEVIKIPAGVEPPPPGLF